MLLHTLKGNEMNEKQSFDLLAQIKQFVPNARSTKTTQTRNTKRDTEDAAREKVVTKLLANKAYFNDPSLKRPDSLYKKQADDNYAIGIKYGNRYLQKVANGQPYIENIPADKVAEVLESMATAVTEKHYDAEIKTIMQENIANRSKARQ
jgi:chorismate mutase